MALRLIREELNGIMVFVPEIFGDIRGYFMESYNKNDLKRFGIDAEFVQDNHSRSFPGTIRGMHIQYDKPQGKLIRVTAGYATFNEIDLRPNSKTYGQHVEIELSVDDKRILWVPPGFANGFLAEMGPTEVQYKCTEFWDPKSEITIRYDDPEIGIVWDVEKPKVSQKDLAGISFAQWKEADYSKFLI